MRVESEVAIYIDVAAAIKGNCDTLKRVNSETNDDADSFQNFHRISLQNSQMW